MGWYHSHRTFVCVCAFSDDSFKNLQNCQLCSAAAFDLGENSHCFLSQTDLSTQLQWQRAEDPHSNPFAAIVIDPLRSIHLGIPEMKAFRAYPPEYNSPVANECPDGSVEASEQQRLELWGSCWNRYYEMVSLSIIHCIWISHCNTALSRALSFVFAED